MGALLKSRAEQSEADVRARWLEERRSGIGGSDAAVVMGASRWKSPFALWAEKTGLADLSTEETEIQRWGHIMEEPIRQEYERLTGRRVIRTDPYKVTRHPTLPFMICTLDGMVEADDREGLGPLSIKTVAPFKAKEWEDETEERPEAPIEYEVQLQHETEVVGASWGSFAVLIWGRPLVWFDVTRNERFAEALRDRCADFWRRVENGQAPEADGTESAIETLRKLHPKEEEGRIVKLPDEALAWDRAYEDLELERKDVEKRRKELRARFQQALGDAEVGILPDGTRWTWKTQSRAGHTVGPWSGRVLTRKGAK